MKIKNSLQVITILLVGLILTWAVLKTDHTPDLNQTEENQDQGVAEEHEDRGPNGGRMFSEGGLNVEVTILIYFNIVIARGIFYYEEINVLSRVTLN